MAEHSGERSGKMTAGPLLVAAVFALMLAAWRGVAILPAAEPLQVGTAFEQRLTRLGATLAGPDAIRVAASQHDGGPAHVLVLLDPERVPAGFERTALEDVLAAGGLLDVDAGDRLEIRQTSFAPAMLSRPSLMELAEVFALLALAGWLGRLAMTEDAHAPDLREAIRPAHDVTQLPAAYVPVRENSAVLEAARKDPARTARVIRAWLAGEGAYS